MASTVTSTLSSAAYLKVYNRCIIVCVIPANAFVYKFTTVRHAHIYIVAPVLHIQVIT